MRGRENIDCFVLFPEGLVSPIQQRQMTSVLDPNVHCLSVKGTFDDCQDIVKGLFNDLELKEKFGFGAVNSINWARIMLQITYYFFTFYKLFPKCDGSVSFSVPTGNFGDILAGYYAKRMGLPVRNLVVATNSNDILHRFFTTGEYDKDTVQQTSSPSMDIQISSNFERYLFYLFQEDTAKLSEAMAKFKRTGELHVSPEMRASAGADFVSASSSDDRVRDTISSCFTKNGYTLCPHTACGASALEQLRDRMQWQTVSSHEVVVLATAHPAKFCEAVEKATGAPVKMPPALARAEEAKTRCTTLPNSLRSVRDAIERTLLDRGAEGQSSYREGPKRAESTLTPEAWLALEQKTGG